MNEKCLSRRLVCRRRRRRRYRHREKSVRRRTRWRQCGVILFFSLPECRLLMAMVMAIGDDWAMKLFQESGRRRIIVVACCCCCCCG